MAAVNVRLRNEANTSTTNELDGAYDVTFRPERNAKGTGSFKIANDDSAMASLNDGDVVRFALAGTGIFPARIVRHEAAEVDRNDEGIEATEWFCEGLLVDFEEAKVRPPSIGCDLVPSVDERVFSIYGPDYDDSGWEFATEIALQGWGSAFYTGQPGGFTDPAARWICASDGDDSDAPEGVRPVRRVVLVDAGPKWIEWAADNGADFYVMGKQVQRGVDFRKSQQYEFETTSGYLTLGWSLENAEDDGPPGGNPTALIWSLREGGPEGTIIYRSDDNCRILPADTPPDNMPLGEIHRKAREGNDLLDLWSVVDSDDEDYNGATYPTVPELAFRYYEDSLLDLVNIYADTWVDVKVAPSGKELQPRVKGTTGTTSTLDLVTGYSTAGIATPANVNVLDLSWDVRQPLFDGIAVRDANGWVVRGDEGGRLLAYRMEQIVDRGIAETLADELLAIYATEQATARFTYLPLDESTDLPFDAFDLFDTLAVPSEGDHDTTTDQQVLAITVMGGDTGDTEAEDGAIVVAVGSPIKTRQELLEARLKRVGAGALAGVGSAASGGKAPPRRLFGTPATPLAGGPAQVIASCPNANTGDTMTFPCRFVGKVTALRLIGQGGTGTSTVYVSDGVTTTTLTGTGDGLVDYADITDTTWTTVTELTVTLNTVNHTHLHVYADVTEVQG